MADAAEFLTFLFTDLEGSTALWERHPAEMPGVLERHDELLRIAITTRDGTVVGGRGDGLFAVFATPRDAVAATQDAQRALADESWPDGMALRVRMGVHTGQATAREGDWFGTEVNRAARVMSVAHGGQVVCTRIVEELVRDDFDLVDLGEHRLRDLQSTVHLFQVEIPGAASVHPPLRSIDAHLTNLPYELSTFIGREGEQDDVAGRLREARLVTIVGVGGVGKTRLALQVGGALLPEHADGVWLCELASVSDPDDLADAIAGALRYTPPPGVPVATGLQQHLQHKRVLLVLDNCEHVVGVVAQFVAETTTSAPDVSVLATSREALGVRGEHIYPLASLTVPSTPDAETVLTSEAGALFMSRAREAGGDVTLDERNASAIHSLCRRLDGIPLALELAAAQTALMTPAEIERRIDKQFTTTTGARRGALERHQTLRAAIDWSYDLLTPSAQILLQRLSICVGGFDLDAASALAEGIDADGFDLLRELVAKSLVERYEANANTRYRLLEMIRQHAAERLDGAGETPSIRDRHAAHYADVVVRLFADVRSNDEYEVLELIAIETPNIAAGLRWWTATERAAEVLGCFDRMPFIDAFVLPPAALDELATAANPAIETPGAEHLPGFSKACMFVGFQVFMNGDLDAYRRLQARAEGNHLGSATVDTMVALFDGDMPTAVGRAADAVVLARTLDDDAQLAWLLSQLAMMETTEERATGDQVPTAAIAHADEALAVAQRVPGTIARFYPLATAVEANRTADLDRALRAAAQVSDLDRTQRRWWATIATNSAGLALSAVGGAITQRQLTEWRNALADFDQHDERFLFIMLVATVSDTIADHDSELAMELAAIVESNALAPQASFSRYAALGRLAEEQPDAVAAARMQAEGLSYRDAVDRVLERLDTLIAAQSPSDE